MYYPVSALLIECLILSVVRSKDSYGYEISQTVKIAAEIKESTLYPILKKLQESGYLTSYSSEYNGRQRKYYSITEAGKEHFKYLKSEWQIYSATISSIIDIGEDEREGKSDE